MRLKVVVSLTEREAQMVRLCIAGELENEDDYSGDYFAVLRRVAKKLDAARVVDRSTS